METSFRSLVKSVIWTGMGLVTMALVGLAFTGSIAVGGTMALVNSILGLTMYLVYERVWARINWGRRDG